MRDDDEIIRLLDEIRDLHREHLDEYRRNVERTMEVQERAIHLHREQLDEYRRNVERSMEVQERAIRMQAISVARQRIGLLIIFGMFALLVLLLLVPRG